MRIRAKHYLIGLSLLAFTALPVWAHTDTAKLTVLHQATVAGKTLKPGTYKLEVQSNQTQMKIVNTESYKTVADVPVHWIQVQKAPNNTEVIMSKHHVSEVEFSGKTQAVRIG